MKLIEIITTVALDIAQPPTNLSPSTATIIVALAAAAVVVAAVLIIKSKRG